MESQSSVKSTTTGMIAYCTICLLVSIGSGIANDATRERYRFAIDPQPLDDALAEVSNTAKVHIARVVRLVEGKQSPGLYDTYSVPEALDLILESTGLTYRYTGKNTIAVMTVAEATREDNPIMLADSNVSARKSVDRDIEASDSSDDRHYHFEETLQTITIIGERVERSVYETASSVAVITGEDLEETPAIQNVEDALEDIPNVLTFGGSSQAPAIRGQASGGPLFGLDAFFAGALPRATITLDGRALSYFELVYGVNSVWDLESIEVFRGPQTTSQGANSIAGAIYARTKDPTYEFESAARAQLGSFDSRHYSAMVSGPLIADELALRITADFRERDTYISYQTPGQNLIDDARFIDQFTGRIKLLWEPLAISGLSTKLTYARTDTNQPISELVDEPFEDQRVTRNPNPAGLPTDSHAVIHDIKYHVSDALTVKNQFQWGQYSVQRTVADVEAGFFDLDGEDFVNETLANFNLMQGRLTGVAGLHLRNIEESTDFRFGFSDTEFTDKKNNVGVFTELTYYLTDKLDFTAGIRYQRDQHERKGTAFVGSPFPPDVTIDFDETFDAWLPKFAVGYNVNEQLRVGGIVSRGYNPGGTNLNFGLLFSGNPDAAFDFDDETLWNYELYARSSLLDNRLNLAANLFYTDFNDTQRAKPEIFPFPQFNVVNADKAESYGLELSANYQATHKFGVYAALGLLETEIKESSDTATNLNGNEFSFAPGLTGTIGFNWEVIDNLTFGAKLRHNTGYFSDDENTKLLENDAFTVVDLKLNYMLKERFKLYAYANNVFDDFHTTEKLFFAAGTPQATLGVEREFGTGVIIEF